MDFLTFIITVAVIAFIVLGIFLIRSVLKISRIYDEMYWLKKNQEDMLTIQKELIKTLKTSNELIAVSIREQRVFHDCPDDNRIVSKKEDMA